MKTNSLYIHREIAGESLLIPVGEATKKLNGMIQLNKVATFIWKNIDTASSLEEIVSLVCQEFEVELERARTDVLALCKELYERDLISEVPEFE